MSTASVSKENFRALRLVGSGLIILAFALPALGFAGGGYGVAELVTALLGAGLALLIIAGTARLITWKRSHRAKVYGRIAVGLLLCLNMSVKLSDDLRDHEASKEYARQLSEVRKQQAAVADVLQRYERLDLSEVVTPEALTTAQGIATGRSAVARYHGLIAERRTLLKSLLEKMLDAAAVSPGLSMEEMQGRNPVDIEVYASLDTNEPAVASAMDAILDWASEQQGRLKQANGEYQFADARQEAEMESLLAGLDDAESVMADAHAKVMLARIKPQLDDFRRRINQSQGQQAAQ